MSGIKPRRCRGTASAALLCAALLGSGAALACTTLAITDAQGGVYFGRTLEMAMESPYQVSYFPAGRRLSSTLADGKPGLDYQTRYAILAVTVPLASPTDLTSCTIAAARRSSSNTWAAASGSMTIRSR